MTGALVFHDFDDNVKAAFDYLEVDNKTTWAELRPTGTCDGNGTLRSFEARDFEGRLDYFIDLNFEDEIYERVWHRIDNGETWTNDYDIQIRKFVIIHGNDRERTYKREHAATLKDAAVMFHNLVKDFASDRWNVYDY